MKHLQELQWMLYSIVYETFAGVAVNALFTVNQFVQYMNVSVCAIRTVCTSRERERERELLHWYLTVANCPTRTVHCFVNEPELHERHSWCAPVLITSLLEFYCCCCCAKSRNQERTKVISGRSSFILFLVSDIYHRPKSEFISPDCAGSTKVHHTHQQ